MRTKQKWIEYVEANPSADYKATLAAITKKGWNTKTNGTPVSTKDIANHLWSKGLHKSSMKTKRRYNRRPILNVPVIESNRVKLIIGTPTEIAAVIKEIA